MAKSVPPVVGRPDGTRPMAIHHDLDAEATQ